MTTDPMAAIRETFFQECEEQLAELESGLIAMDEGAADAETVNAVFRAVHSIKGGAGAFKLQALIHFAHVFETSLDLVRGGKLAATSEVTKTMLRAADALADLVRAARDGSASDSARVATLTAELAALATKPAQQETQEETQDAASDGLFGFAPVTLDIDALDAAAAQGFEIFFRPTPDLYRLGHEPVRLLRELARLGDMTTVCESEQLAPLGVIDPHGAYLGFRATLRTDVGIDMVREVFDFVGEDCDLTITPLAAPAADALSEPDDDSQAEIARLGFTPTPISLDDPAPEEVEPEAKAEAFTPEIAKPEFAKPEFAKPEIAKPEIAKADAPKLDAAKPEAAKPEIVKTDASASIRVDLDRVDRLINVVGELVINQAMLSQRVVEADIRRASGVASALASLDQLTREIQEGVMAIRAQPVKTLFQRMSRIMREVAEATGKSVRLRTEGEGVEVDRTVIERLADPLTHMIRNAVDHGLESKEARRAAGKNEQGEVRLSASHRSGRIVIEVSDDGAGIDRARVRAKAVERELISPDAQLSPGEIDNLLFLPGFSTAATVSDISGRGVGMDVVKRSIQALGGRISISSKPGEGTTFSMSVPLTLAVLDGMVVRAAGETLVIPLAAIVETLRPKPRDVHGLGRETRVIADRGGFVPLIDVGREFNFREETTDPVESVVLIVETEVSTRSALIVDAIVDQRQVVIKSLETNYQNVPGIAAATILGDGRVALIIDIDAFVARAHQGGAVQPLRAAS
jgi:two-component system chemotaxis sensor kinase CheA